MNNYIVYFEYTNVPNFALLRAAMRNELARVHNVFAKIVNGEMCERLNKEFYEEHPGYEIADDFWSSVEYVQHFHRAWSEVVDKLNRENVSPLLEFYIGNELELIGRLKLNKNATISYYIKEEGS